MSEDWTQAKSQVAALVEQDDAARGWVNTKTEEVVVRRPLLEDDNDLPMHGVYHYRSISENGNGFNRQLLFRGESETNLDERTAAWLKDSETPDDPGQFDTALSPEQIRRSELVHVTSLKDWAHLVGAKYYIGEKIGNRRESSGDVALFEGSTRRGEGSYVALASERGPRGRDYISVGGKPSGYYTVDQQLKSRRGSQAVEIESPTVTYDGSTIYTTDPSESTSITITAQTKNPDFCLATKE